MDTHCVHLQEAIEFSGGGKVLCDSGKNSIKEDREKEKEKKVAKKGRTLGFPASKRQEREKV